MRRLLTLALAVLPSAALAEEGPRPSDAERAAEIKKKFSGHDEMSAAMDELDRRLTIYFKDAEGNAPLAGVKVTIEKASYVSDARGRVLFPEPSKDSLELCLSAEKAGYATLRASLVLEGRTLWKPTFLMHVGDAGGAEKCGKDIQAKLEKKNESIDIHVSFELNKADLTALGKQQVDEIARGILGTLNESAKARFRLIGHTDARGSDKDNLELSKKRAESVRAYLLDKYTRIKAEALEAEGKGKTQLLAKGDDEASHAKNRRVEVKRID